MNRGMRRHGKIYVAGHLGLAGSAIVRQLRESGYSNLVLRTHAEVDLIDQQAVRGFFEQERPEYVFLAAAKVGGILANSIYPAEFIHQNLAIQTNIIHEAWRVGVKRLLFLGSSCIYPRDCPQPIREEYLLSGPLEPTNRPYAVAKIAGIETCWAFNRQYGTQFLSVMPTNLYGPRDNYDLETAHVIPALIRKMHEASLQSKERALVWGSGAPRREFLYSEDMANACVYLMNLPDEEFNKLTADPSYAPIINIGCGEDITIRELAELVAKTVNFKGELTFDASKPDGTIRKLLDVSRLTAFGWSPKTSLEEGLRMAYYSSGLSGVPSAD